MAAAIPSRPTCLAMKMSRVEAAPRAALRFFEAFNRQDIAAMIARLSHDCRFEPFDPGEGEPILEGREAIADYWRIFFAAAPVARIEPEEVVGMGYRCIVTWRLDGLGESPLRGVDVFRVVEALITEQRAYVKQRGGCSLLVPG